jgi:hypothetical protein
MRTPHQTSGRLLFMAARRAAAPKRNAAEKQTILRNSSHVLAKARSVLEAGNLARAMK